MINFVHISPFRRYFKRGSWAGYSLYHSTIIIWPWPLTVKLDLLGLFMKVINTLKHFYLSQYWFKTTTKLKHNSLIKHLNELLKSFEIHAKTTIKWCCYGNCCDIEAQMTNIPIFKILSMSKIRSIYCWLWNVPKNKPYVCNFSNKFGINDLDL